MKKQPYDLFVGRDYESVGEKKTSWHRVGVAFALDNGGLSCEVIEGMALTGRFIIKERKEKPSKEVAS